MFSTERFCYNPTQCGYIELGNTATILTNTHYLNYVYDTNADTSVNPYAGTVQTVIPINGAKWVNTNLQWPEILSEATRNAGWYVKNIPMITYDGTTGVEVQLMWDVVRGYCTGYVNCPS